MSRGIQIVCFMILGKRDWGCRWTFMHTRNLVPRPLESRRAQIDGRASQSSRHCGKTLIIALPALSGSTRRLIGSVFAGQTEPVVL